MNRAYAEGPIVVEQRPLTGYRAIEVCDGLKVRLIKGDSPQISVSTQQSLQAFIETYVSDSTLVVKVKDRTSINGSPMIDICAVSPQIEQLKVAGMSELIVDNCAFTTSLMIDCVDGGQSLINGCVDTLIVYGSNGSKLNNMELICNKYLNIKLDNGSMAEFTLNGIADVELSAGSIFRYSGTATIRSSNITGGSQIIKQ